MMPVSLLAPAGDPATRPSVPSAEPFEPDGDHQVWVVEGPPRRIICGTLERAREAAERYNAARGPDEPEAFPAIAQAVVGRKGLVRPRCRLIVAEVPHGLWETFAERCQRTGLDPSRLLSALLLGHVNNRGPEDFGSGMVKNLKSWETTKRKLRSWPAVDATANTESEVSLVASH